MNNLTTTVLLLLVSTLLYAQPVSVTRIDGVGAGNNFLEISDETRFSIFNNTNNGEITYLPDHGPIKVTVTNTSSYTLGDYELTLIDEELNNNALDTAVFWQLTHIQSGTTITSDLPITEAPEQYVSEFGITVEVMQTADAGNMGPNNGAIGVSLEYEDDQGPQWFSGIPDEYEPTHLNYNLTAPGEYDNPLDPNEDFSTMGQGFFTPYTLANWRPESVGFDYLSPSWFSPNSDIVRVGNALDSLNNIDLIFTANKDQWSRCVIVETAGPQYYDEQPDGLSLETENEAENMSLRNTQSVSPNDDNGDGFPDPETNGQIGLGWFPGYAIDVETGKRLNVFFGENSTYSLFQDENLLEEYDITADDFNTTIPTGRDMLWNPTSEILVNAGVPDGFKYQHYMGGQHYIYITREEYDGCAAIHQGLSDNTITKIFALRKLTWTAMPVLTEGTSLLPLTDGLIPNDLIVKLRVDNPFQVKVGTGDFNGYPTYRFEVEPLVSTNNPQEDSWTNSVYLSPNPYHSESQQELQLHNLPNDCTVTLFGLTGQKLWSKEYEQVPSSSTAAISLTQLPALSKGVYFVRIQQKNQTWKVLKWVVI